MAETPIQTPELDAGQPEISMAPLIDVVFLLLIFFMVTTVFPDNEGLLIEKPGSQQSETLPKESLRFAITRDNTVVLDSRPIALEDIETLVRTRLSHQPDTAVTLDVDRLATTETLIQVMDACKLGGATKVGIATDATDKDV